MARFQHQHVGSTFDETRRLLVVVSGQLVKGQAASDGYRPGRRPHGAVHETRFVGVHGRRVIGGLPGDAGGLAVDPARLVSQVILAQHERGCAEGVGLYDVGAGFQVSAVDVLDHVRARYVEILVTALVLLSPKILGAQTP